MNGFLGNVDHNSNREHFDNVLDVLDSGGILTLDLPEIEAKGL